MLTHLGGFESTQIFASGQDILGTTRHIELWASDLALLLESGIRNLRYSIPWHRIENKPGEFDWSWMDGPMGLMHSLGMVPIVDPLHHTSFPTWLTGGFLNPNFPALYKRFIDHFSARYQWVTKYTIINEPLATTLFCSYTGMWYPYRASDRDFVAMALQVARCFCQSSSLLKRKNKQTEIIYVGTAEHHQALDSLATAWVDHANARRFLILDLVLGRVNRTHPLYTYLTSHGASDEDLSWLRDHRACIDILGLDYYVHSEMEWFWCDKKGRADIAPFNNQPHGFAGVAEDYTRIYAVPIMLSETNIRGTVHERITWLKFMEEQCEQLMAAGHDLRGFCWYPSIDSTDWSSACTECTGIVDPQGIWTLDADRVVRHESELSHVYRGLARGKITSKDIPAYPFGRELQRRLRSYFPMMNSGSRPAGLTA